MAVEIHVPYLYNDDRHYARLSGLVEAALDANDDVVFKFADCGFLMANAVVVLGGVIRLLESRGKKATIDTDSMREPVFKNLARSDFLKTHCGVDFPWRDNAVRYREDPESDQLGAARYLEEEWLGRDWPIKIDSNLKSAISSRIVEIYLNAFEHSRSTVGVFSCGQFYHNKKRLQLAVADFGVGIPGNVREFTERTTGKPISSGADCMEWAFLPGTSTNPIMGRGLGLDLLREFIMVNNGALRIHSGDGIAEVTASGARYRSAKHHFRGTLVDVEVACDEHSYKLEQQHTQYAVRREA